jgi:DNA polymerase III subunit chi
MEIWFYHLTRQPLAETLPLLVERSLERGWRVVIQSREEESLAGLDDLLWTWSDISFIPHGTARDGAPETQPVFLTAGAETPNGARIRFFVEGAEATPFLDQAEAAGYERLVLMFDGSVEESLRAARAQWKALKERGCALSYWRQGETGGWERVA